jgi:hypothetical protein
LGGVSTPPRLRASLVATISMEEVNSSIKESLL